MSKLLPLILALAMANATAQVYNGQTYGDRQFGAWTGHLVTHGNDARFRTSGISGNWSLNLDAIPPSCNFLVSLTLWIGGETVKEDIAPADYAGAVRVDQNDIWDIKFSTSASMGDTALIFTAYPTPAFSTLLAQMQTGQQLMVRLTTPEGKPYYATFPLNGFVPAAQYETAACAKAAAMMAAPTQSTHPRKKPPPPAAEKIL